MFRSILFLLLVFVVQNVAFGQCFIPDYTHVYCPDDYVLDLTLAETNGNGTYTYTENLIEIIAPYSYIPTGSTIINGTFMENGTGCISEFQVIVEAVVFPDTDLLEEYFLTCELAGVTINLNQQEDPFIDYYWIDPSGSTFAVDQEVYIEELGTYTLEMFHLQYFCTVFVEFDLSFDDSTIPDATSEVVQNCDSTANIVLSTNLDTSNLSVEWFGPGLVDLSDPFNIQVNLPGIYQFDLTNTTNGCGTTETVEVTEIECVGSNVEELLQASDISIFPNPSNGIFTIKPIDFVGKVNIEIYNIVGNLVWRKSNLQFNESKVVDLQSLPNGVYFIEIHSGGLKLVSRVEKH